MNKEKQIEEMAKVYEEARCKANETLGSMNEGADNWYAKAFYNAGYRKIYDDHQRQCTCYALGCQMAEELKCAFAREIINDTKGTLLDYHFQENKKYQIKVYPDKKRNDMETARYRAITDAIIFAIETLNKIERKYTEEGK